MKKLLPLMILVLALGSVPAAAQEAPGGVPAVTIYPSFHVKFGNDGGNYLLSSIVILNISGYAIQNIHLTQTFPKQFIPSPAPDGIHEYVERPEGTKESIDGQTFELNVPVLRRRELTVGFALLKYKGRPSSAEIPPAKVDYSVLGRPQSQVGPSLTLDLKKYTKYSGSLSDFLKRYAGMLMKFPTKSGPDWGFSSLADRVRGKTPVGILEIEGDKTKGRYSLISGAPGDAREMLVSWMPVSQAKPAATKDQVMQILEHQIFASADFDTDFKGGTLEQVHFARGKGWKLSSTWKDAIQSRLGGGPILWYVYNDEESKTQYIVMLRAQGRGAGPGKADKPNPEKEEALIKELEGIISSLRLY